MIIVSEHYGQEDMKRIVIKLHIQFANLSKERFLNLVKQSQQYVKEFEKVNEK